MKYVMSDIHGNWEGYQQMKEKIHLSEDDTLLIIGDVIDRGKDGIKILQDVMAADNIKMMLGNHELMMFESDMLDRGVMKFNNLDKIRSNWIEDNGGYYTMKAFCDLSEGKKNEIMDFIQSLVNTAPLKYISDADGRKFAVCHGWPSMDPRFVGKSQVDLYNYVFGNVWNRPESRNSISPVMDFIKSKGVQQLIIGHTPVQNLCTMNERREMANSHPRILHTPWYIDIDCGCGHRGGCLGCLCIDTMEEFYV